MAKLIYGMLMSLDGYIEDEHGGFGWAAPDEEVHAYVNELGSSVGTYLYGRRMYETMVYWETAHLTPDQPQVMLNWARQWQAAEKIVYSSTLTEPRSERTRVEREFSPAAVQRLKTEAEHDITVAGPELAAQVVRAGLVDEFQMIICPVIVGGGKRFFPAGVRLDLELIEDRLCQWRSRSAVHRPRLMIELSWYSILAIIRGCPMRVRHEVHLTPEIEELRSRTISASNSTSI